MAELNLLQPDKPSKVKSIFRTFEFALFPFVPFSQRWRTMYAETSGREGDFAWGPRGFADTQMPRKNEKWDALIEDYNRAQGKSNNLIANLKKFNENFARSETQKMAQDLQAALGVDYLGGEGIEGAGPEKYITESLDAVMGAQGLRAGDKRKGNLSWKMTDESKENIKINLHGWEKSNSIAGSETLDIMAKIGDDSKRKTEYLLHRIGEYAGGKFVSDVMGIEATNQTTGKYLEAQLTDEKYTGTMKESFQAAARDMANDIARQYNVMMNMFNKKYGSLKMVDILEKTGKRDKETADQFIERMIKAGADSTLMNDSKDAVSTKHMGGDETLWFITRQMLDRFIQIRDYDKKHVSDGIASYIYQIPLRHHGGQTGEGYTIGFAKFSPKWGVGRTKLRKYVEGATTLSEQNIHVETFVLDMLDIGTVKQKWITKETLQQIFTTSQKEGRYAGLVENFILWDYAVRLGDKDKVATLANRVNSEVAGLKDVGLHGRQYLIGSSAWTQIDNMTFGALAGAGNVVGLSTMTDRDTAEVIRRQFKAYFDTKGNAKLGSALKTLFQKAVLRSNIVTQAWKDEIPGAEGFTVSQGSILAGKKLYKGDPMEGGTGVGVPFTFMSGRRGTTQQYEKFKATKSEWLMHTRFQQPPDDYKGAMATRGHTTGDEDWVSKIYNYDFMESGDMMDWRLTVNTSQKASIRFFKDGKRWHADREGGKFKHD